MLQTKFIFDKYEQLEQTTNAAIQDLCNQGMKILNVSYNSHANNYTHAYSVMILYDNCIIHPEPEKPDTDQKVAYCTNCNRFLKNKDIRMSGALAVCKNCGVGTVVTLYKQ